MILKKLDNEKSTDFNQLDNTGLFGKLEYFNYLKEKQIELPVCYHLTQDDQVVGHALFSKSYLDWKFILGENNLFTLKTSGLALRNDFNDLDISVYQNLEKDEILSQNRVDAMLLFSIPTSYLNNRKTLALNRPSGLIRYMPRPSSEHYFLKIDCTFDEYLKKLSRNSRQTLKKKVRRFSKRCKNSTSIKFYEEEKDVEEFIDLALKISSKTYQHRLLGAGLESSSDFKDYLIFLARNDFLNAYILFDGDYPVAYLYSTKVDGRVETHKTGYDPKYAKMSPGTVLYYHAIKIFFEQGDAHIIDFSTGSGPLKKLFSTDSTQCVDVYYIRKSIKMLTIIILHRIFNECVNLIRRLTEKAGLKEKIKRYFRSR